MTCNLRHPKGLRHPVLNVLYEITIKLIFEKLLTSARPSITHCNTLHYTATHCITLQHTATHCNKLHHTATHCSTLQHTASHCNTLQHTATHCNTLQHTASHCITLLHTASHCNTLQHTATHCTTLQHTAAHCNTCVKILKSQRSAGIFFSTWSSSVLQYCAVCCSVLKCVAELCRYVLQ